MTLSEHSENLYKNLGKLLKSNTGGKVYLTMTLIWWSYAGAEYYDLPVTDNS